MNSKLSVVDPRTKKDPRVKSRLLYEETFEQVEKPIRDIDNEDDLNSVPMDIDSDVEREKEIYLVEQKAKLRHRLRRDQRKIKKLFNEGLKLAKRATEDEDKDLRNKSRELINYETDRIVRSYKENLVVYRKLHNDPSWEIVDNLSIKEIKHRLVFRKHNFRDNFFS